PLPEGAVVRLGCVRFHHGAAVSLLRYSSDGKSLLSVGGRPAGSPLTLRRWDLATGEAVQTLPLDHTGAALTALTSDAKLLATSDRKTIRLWDVQSGKKVRELGADQPHVMSLAFSPDASLVAAGRFDSTICVWE